MKKSLKEKSVEQPKWSVSVEENDSVTVIFNLLRPSRNDLGKSKNCPEHGKKQQVNLKGAR